MNGADPYSQYPLISTDYNPNYIPSGQHDLLFGQQQDMAKMLEKLLEDADLKEKMQGSSLWAITTKSFILTFLTDLEAEILRHKFKEALISMRNAVPEWDWTDEKRMFFNNLEMVFEANIGRAKGTDANKINERTLISTQIQHRTSVFADTSGGERGVLGRIKGMFGR